MENIIFTIGHSNHPIEYFLELLKAHHVNMLIDVRSVAASKYNPQFNKEPLANFLKKNAVKYMHFDKEFGARHSEPELLDEEGKVDFEKVRMTSEFKSGVERIKTGIEKGFVIALMCSEAEPFDCHRFAMVSIQLEKEGFKVKHILKDKSLKTNDQLESQLLKKYDKKIPKPSIFEPDISLNTQIDFAYKLRNKEIAYSPYSKELEEQL